MTFVFSLLQPALRCILKTLRIYSKAAINSSLIGYNNKLVDDWLWVKKICFLVFCICTFPGSTFVNVLKYLKYQLFLATILYFDSSSLQSDVLRKHYVIYSNAAINSFLIGYNKINSSLIGYKLTYTQLRKKLLRTHSIALYLLRRFKNYIYLRQVAVTVVDCSFVVIVITVIVELLKLLLLVVMVLLNW